MASSIEKGRQKEYKAIKWLTERGYTCIRSAASKGPADIIATNDEHIRFIQVFSVADEKVKDSDLRDARAYFRLLHVPPNTYKEIWVWWNNHGWLYCETI